MVLEKNIKRSKKKNKKKLKFTNKRCASLINHTIPIAVT